jgi:hypothetical protein
MTWKCAEPLTAILGGCVALCLGRIDAGVGIGAAMGGAALIAAWREANQKAEPDRKAAIARIRRRVKHHFQGLEADDREARARLDRADAALAEILPQCLIDPSRLALAAVDVDGFAAAAAKQVLSEVARISQLFNETNGPLNQEREFAASVIDEILRATLDDRDYFAKLQPYFLSALGVGVAEIRDGVRRLADDTANDRIRDKDFQVYAIAALDKILERNSDAWSKIATPESEFIAQLLNAAGDDPLEDLPAAAGRVAAFGRGVSDLAAMVGALEARSGTCRRGAELARQHLSTGDINAARDSIGVIAEDLIASKEWRYGHYHDEDNVYSIVGRYFLKRANLARAYKLLLRSWRGSANRVFSGYRIASLFDGDTAEHARYAAHFLTLGLNEVDHSRGLPVLPIARCIRLCPLPLEASERREIIHGMGENLLSYSDGMGIGGRAADAAGRIAYLASIAGGTVYASAVSPSLSAAMLELSWLCLSRLDSSATSRTRADLAVSSARALRHCHSRLPVQLAQLRLSALIEGMESLIAQEPRIVGRYDQIIDLSHVLADLLVLQSQYLPRAERAGTLSRALASLQADGQDFQVVPVLIAYAKLCNGSERERALLEAEFRARRHVDQRAPHSPTSKRAESLLAEAQALRLSRPAVQSRTD